MALRHVFGAMIIGAVIVLPPGLAFANHVVITSLVDTDDGWIGFGAEPSVNDEGDVAFISRMGNDPNEIYVHGFFGGMTTISRITAGGDELGLDSNPLISNNGTVTFLGTAPENVRGVYQGTGVGVTTLADSNGDATFFQQPSVNNFGEVAYIGFNTGVSGIYFASPGGGSVLIEDANGPRSSFGPPVLNDEADVAYTAFRDSGGSGIIVDDSGTGIVEFYTTDHAEGFLGFGDPAINLFGATFIGVDSSGDVGIFYATSDTIETIAHEDDGFSNLSQPAITKNGEIVYVGQGAGFSKGIYYDLGPGLDNGLLVGTGQELFGSTVTGLEFEADGLSSLGFVTFIYGLADGRSGIALSLLPSPLYNGDFEDDGGGGGGGGEQEEIFGWQVSGTDENGEMVDTPHITTQTSGSGNKYLQLKTGAFDDGILKSTISQTFVVHDDAPFLSFNLTNPVFEEDITGTGSSDPGGLNTNELHDRVEVSLEAGGERYLLLVMGVEGIVVGPFDPVFPGALLASASLDDEFDLTFSADLSDFINMPVAVFIDVINEDDFLLLDPNLDAFQLTATAPAVPEPSSLAALAVLTLAGCSRRRH